MAFNRAFKRPDKVTQQIVDELRALGFSVTHIGEPVDLAVHHHKWGSNIFRFLEVKSRRRVRSGAVSSELTRGLRVNKDYQYEDDNYEDSGGGIVAIVLMIIAVILLAVAIRGDLS